MSTEFICKEVVSFMINFNLFLARTKNAYCLAQVCLSHAWQNLAAECTQFLCFKWVNWRLGFMTRIDLLIQAQEVYLARLHSSRFLFKPALQGQECTYIKLTSLQICSCIFHVLYTVTIQTNNCLSCSIDNTMFTKYMANRYFDVTAPSVLLYLLFSHSFQ